MLNGIRRALADVQTMKTLLPVAERIANDEGLPAPAAEHLVLAALELPDESARRAIRSAGAGTGDLRAALEAQDDDALGVAGVSVDRAAIRGQLPPPPAQPRGIYRSEPSAQALFQRVRLLARADGVPIRGAHVILAATELEHGTIPRALARLGITRETLAVCARRELDGTGDPS